ncbi:UDP-N-acetylglucosamine 2-epimerase (non-hydrolyzing) [candidate division WOR-3 bacterium]|nr:UDP-N-acetylglucosamine 2-epimerase (non-hydrolyzing) [Candidatus Parcubacteria bacterium]MCK4528471.1 UDP-N-acetylglucosamine 2-epimerase (non-hydrolyzing) [candidate division WOR-3 bacterium]
MKIVTVAGTRPELIRLSVLIKKLDKLVDHIFVYTNQNYDYNLSRKFFDELHIRKPDYYFKGEYSFVKFLSLSMLKLEEIIIKEKPNKMLILGDTNSGLLSIVAEKYNIPVYHMEAGNRCYDDRVPEETNRKIIDNVSKYNLPYTENSKQNLLSEGFHKNYIFKIGNPIYEVLNYYKSEIENSNILNKLFLRYKKFVLVTVHRAENVDSFTSLSDIVNAINEISRQFKVVVSLHPRTKDKMKKFNIKVSDDVVLSEPFGFFDFVKLEKSAKIVISDSGTCQEECCIFNVPSITIRNSTERHETIECGSNILSGTNYVNIIRGFDAILKRNNVWVAPSDYIIENVSDTVINILIGKV